MSTSCSTADRKKILMVCYYFPPLTDVGCKRSVAFAKYWKKTGWEPHVLSVKNPDRGYCTFGINSAPDGVEVTYTYSLLNVYRLFGKLNSLLCRILRLVNIEVKRNYFYELLCIPDIFMGWIPLAVISGLSIIKNNGIDAIYVSCSPFSSAVVGWVLKQATGKPVVIDYRDAHGLDLRQYQPAFATSWFRKMVDRWISAVVLRACDLFTVTSEEIKALYIDQYPDISDKIHVVYNGFDHENINSLSPVEKYHKFTIIYSGNFYCEIAFDYFFEALGILKRRGLINSGNFQFLFYGGVIAQLEKSLMRHNVSDLVVVRGRIAYSEILNEISRSHLQLLRIIQPMISTKLFEGIALNIPLLATIPEGEVAQIIRKYHEVFYLVTDRCGETVANSIETAMNDERLWSETSGVNRRFIEQFSREKASNDYLDLMNAFCFNARVMR